MGGYMDSSAAQNHHQQSLDSMVVSQAEKKARAAELPAALHCPRCDSSNTKFCYYNNYSLSQPRYFCKACRRYWTKGGTLRNVPVGGGCRKNKRSRTTTHDHPITALTTPNPAIDTLQQKQQPYTNGHDLSTWGNATAPDCSLGMSGVLFETLRSEFVEASSSPSLQNIYNGIENNGGLGFNVGHKMGPIEGLMMSSATTASTAVTTVKHDGDQGRVLWGFPRQNINGDEFDPAGRVNWHSFLNNPLM